jgi:hypothetical protein
VAAVMSSLGITSMAAAAVYYRFAWQMEVRYALTRARAGAIRAEIPVPAARPIADE